MSQMLLPQGSASAISEQAASRPAKSRDGGYADSGNGGNSRYQDVFREHTQTLARQDQAKNRSAAQQAAAKDAKADAQKADAADTAKKPADADLSSQAKADDAGKVNEPRSDNTEPGAITNPQNNSAENADTADLPDPEPVALTFMELQAMLAPMASAPGAAGGAAGINSAGAMPAAGIPGQSLNPLAAPGVIKAGTEGTGTGLSASQAAGLALTDTLRNGESLRPVDGANLVADSRLQGSADSLLQQPNSAARVQTDPALALRGYTTSVDVPVGQADWGDKVMGKLSWLTARNMSVAEIHLSPADLGPMEVKVRMHNDQASITVHAANPMVRDQLEQHSHRLREMLSEQGVSLERFDVSDQSRQQSGEQGNAEAGSSGGQGNRGGNGLASELGGQDAILAGGQLDLSWRGEVDVFA
ncbi:MULTISPECIES: flagellar hook-length control protein FliK [unclassified Marinobacter]|uniref:flagellar hook-length control protein FliK n=1 Tax=unclassified Marinobacter TaxID=83889 RepID=UPI000BF3D2B9|nr:MULTISPECIES: flagellar hook-length control protein FliK [unclassified Marinobacter]PFG11813.1 flagellar hook-length control protein FliK [Marinobacter sp. LV10MA510-1]PFG53595.1 flagellar hook-length control protein FliK [Marinobacter sp. LV10R520-4]